MTTYESKRVESLLSIPMPIRHKQIATDYTNDELLEIHDVCEYVEKDGGRKLFYQRLIMGQTGTFTPAVVLTYMYKLQKLIGVMTLLDRSINMTVIDNLKFIGAVTRVLVSRPSEVPEFYQSRVLEKYGIDILTHPYNKLVLSKLTTFGPPPAELIEDHGGLLWEIVDTLSAKDRIKWLSPPTAPTYVSQYPDTPTEALDASFEIADKTVQALLAAHPNASEELRLTMFERTNDMNYLSTASANLFIF